MLMTNSRPLRLAAVAALLCSALMAFSFGPNTALASGCRTDPVVLLTNGQQLQFEADINTTYTNVRSVVYTIHAPVGSAVALIIYTDNPLGSVETVNFFADTHGDTYSIDTVVTTSNGGTAVATSGILLSVLNVTLDTSRGSGKTGEHILMLFGHQMGWQRQK